jgi:hypothetical protein
MWSVPSCYILEVWNLVRIQSRVEAGSSTSTLALRFVGGDEKGSLKTETVKYGHESQGTRIPERLRGRGQQHIQKTDPSSRHRGRPHKSETVTVKQ